MRHRLTLPIGTERLLLRDFRSDDYEAIYAYASDSEVARQMFYGPRDEADTRGYLARMLGSQEERPRMTWELAVVDRAQDRLVGACDLTLDDEREADLGYILGREAWGRGYATEAARAMVRAGFEQLELERIYGICEVSHAASSRVLEKAGLRWVRTAPQYYEAKGRWWDMHVYEILRADWAEGQFESPESLWGDVKDYLKRQCELLNEEVRTYPTPIARCDDQLTDLLERRARAVNEMRRMDAPPGRSLARNEYVALIKEFIESPSYSRDETENSLKARLTAKLLELGASG